MQASRSNFHSFEAVLSQAETFEGVKGQDECASVVAEVLRRRTATVKTLLSLVELALASVEGFVFGALCDLCFPEEEDAPFRVYADEVEFAKHIVFLGQKIHSLQQDIYDAERNTAGHLGTCLPLYLKNACRLASKFMAVWQVNRHSLPGS